uniref:Sema domain-containing protein n=1 Tax=Kryptolebias marmoratus TaxID=37003 RepID=A0A3Q3AE34_KRYMA
MNLLWPQIIMLFWALCPSVQGHCNKSSKTANLNLSVTYELPTFTADFPVQNMVTLDGLIYVGAVNRIYALAPNLTKLSEYHTGPLLANETCGQTQATGNSNRVDNHNIALVVENIYDKGLYSCGSADNGVCRRHVLDEDNGLKTVDENVYCFTDKLSPAQGPVGDSNVVVSPSGSQVLNVESNVIKFFVGNSEIPSTRNMSGNAMHPHTISIRKMKTSQNGFTFFSNLSHMDLIPSLKGKYYLRYIYSFHSGPFTYFLTVQQKSWNSQTYHTRIVRMCSSDLVIRRYVEMPIECISTNKRRRRSPTDEKVFNILQAAHVTKVGNDVELQRQLMVEEGDDVLFAAFAQGQPDSPEPTPNSAVCVMSLKNLNNLFKMQMQHCKTRDPYHFTSSNKTSCYNLVRAGRGWCLLRWEEEGILLEFWHKDLMNTLVTSITVVPVHGRTVAYLGTADGRHIQVKKVLICQEMTLLITKIPLIGPGCGQLTTCLSCLLSSRVTQCGWCNGQCTRKSQCPSSSEWTQDYCTPVITKVSPMSGPVRGSTAVTVCGYNFGFDKTENFKTSMVSVEVAGIPCKLIRQENINRCVCVSIFRVFDYPSIQDPVIHDIFPTFGPKSGNTMLTISGAFLDTGNKLVVTVGKAVCEIQSLTSTMLTCKTPPNSVRSKQPVKLSVDLVERHAPVTFTYNEDPVINRIQPLRSFVSGGCTVSAHGFFLQSGLQPQMVLSTGPHSAVFHVVSLS